MRRDEQLALMRAGMEEYYHFARVIRAHESVAISVMSDCLELARVTPKATYFEAIRVARDVLLECVLDQERPPSVGVREFRRRQQALVAQRGPRRLRRRR